MLQCLSLYIYVCVSAFVCVPPPQYVDVTRQFLSLLLFDPLSLLVVPAILGVSVMDGSFEMDGEKEGNTDIEGVLDRDGICVLDGAPDGLVVRVGVTVGVELGR